MSEFYTSATQIGTYIDCIRKWWFSSVLKLYTDRGYPFVFGQVFHGVAERYLKEEELFPKGWETVENDSITEEDAALITELIAMAHVEGILQLYDGREVETRFERKLTPSTDIVGYIDLLLPRESTVVDHKTCSDFRWALSENKLEKDIQMLIYAGEFIQRYPDTHDVILRHNQFLKNTDNPKVKFTEARVFNDEIKKTWKFVKSTAMEMEAYRVLEKDRWKDVPPAETSSICNKYGGCPFLRICGKTETINGYCKRTERFLGEKEMSIFDKLKKEQAKELVTESVKKPAPEPAQEPEPEVEEKPPWANPECVACSGAGFNTKGNPCRTCDNKANENGDPKSTDYDLVNDGWVLRKKEYEVQNKSLKKALLAKGNEDVEKTEEGDEPKEEPEKKPEVESKKESKKGRPKAGITLCINSMYTKFGSKNIISLDSIFQDIKKEISKDHGKDFYELDPWKRKDMVAVKVSHLITVLGTTIIVANSMGNGMDFKACLEAFRGYAPDVIEGMH